MLGYADLPKVRAWRAGHNWVAPACSRCGGRSPHCPFCFRNYQQAGSAGSASIRAASVVRIHRSLSKPRPVNRYAGKLLGRRGRELRRRGRFGLVLRRWAALCWDSRGGTALCLDSFVCIVRVDFQDIAARAVALATVGGDDPEFFNDREIGMIDAVDEHVLVIRFYGKGKSVAVECVERK